MCWRVWLVLLGGDANILFESQIINVSWSHVEVKPCDTAYLRDLSGLGKPCASCSLFFTVKSSIVLV
jgi:hypothetical protein